MQFIFFPMLAGLAAVAIPVIIQLLNRKNAAVVRWGAWMFLDRTMKRRKRRVLLEDILLLACRCLIPALAALAFARPFVRPDSPVPWAVVMPALLLAITLFGVSFALWRYPRWRRNMMLSGLVLFALALGAILFERQLNLKRFGLGASKDVVLVIDGSASMSMVREGESNFARAVAEARKYIEEAPRGTAFAVILGGPVPQVMNPVPIADRRVLMNTLDRLAPANGTLQIAPNLTAAAVTLAAGHNAVKQVVIVGDGQTVGWNFDSPERWRTIRRVFAQLKTEPVVVWRTLPLPTSVRNLAVSEVRPSRDVVGTDREVKIDVTVVNAGTEAVTPNAVTLQIGKDVRQALNLRQLEPGASQTFSFPYRFETPGGTLLTAAVRADDDLPADDEYRYVLPVVRSLKVLVVEGEAHADVFRRGSTYVSLALRPELAHIASAAQQQQQQQPGAAPAEEKAYLLDTRVEDVTEAARRKGFGGFAAVVLMNVARLPEPLLEKLADYVNRGGGLLFMPGPRTDRDLFNGWRLGAERVLPLALGPEVDNAAVARAAAEAAASARTRAAGTPAAEGAAAPDAPPAPKAAAIDPSTFTGDVLRRFRTGTDLAGLVPPRYATLEEGVSGAANVIARFSTGQPFLATRALGRGTVCLAAMAFDADSGIVAKRGFVPLMHEIAYSLARPVSVKLDIDPADSPSVLLSPGAASSGAEDDTGLTGYYYPRPNCEGKPVSRRDRNLVHWWGNNAPMKDFPNDHFSVRWRGAITPPETGRYRFEVQVDDSFQFKIDGKPGSAFDLVKGVRHSFEGVYGEISGDAYVAVRWIRPDGRKEDVPESAFRASGGASGDMVEVADPHGEVFHGTVALEKDGYFLKIPRSVFPGLYTVKEVPSYLAEDLADVLTPDGQVLVSVTAGVEESRMEAVTADLVAAVAKHVQLSTATKEEDVIKAIGGQSFGKEIWRTLAVAAFIFLVLEVVVARWIAISRRTGEDIQVDFKNDKLQASEAFRRAVADLDGREGTGG